MIKYFALLLFCLNGLNAAVTGEDDRISYSDLDKISPKTLAKATATQLSRRYLRPDGDDFSYPTSTLQNQCPGEKFSDHPTLGGCSGFLIGENILVAAGHCKDYRSGGCSDDAWLFNHFSKASKKRQSIKKKDLYFCKKILDFKHDGEGDFVVMELDRKVLDGSILEMDLKSSGKKGDPVAVLGYPLGRSFTYTPGGRILSKDKNYLRVDSDAFKNNSGSPLFNLRTAKVEGILTNARRGMSHNPLDGCQLAKSYSENTVLVNRLSRIEYLQKNHSFERSKKSFELINNCSRKVELVLKYRHDQSNDWLTLIEKLEVDEKIDLRNIKNGVAHINLKSENGSALIKGKDFWGFKDSNRDDELGFKKVQLSKLRELCL